MPDEHYLIQASTNLVNWINISTNIAVSSFMDLVDLDAPNYPHRFYRSALFDAVIGGQIGGATRASDGSVNFRITGLEGRTYLVQTSSDLKNWINLSTNGMIQGSIQFTNRPDANFRARFFRLK